MRRTAQRSTAGTTLVELLVTVVFLSVCAVPMLTVINQSQVRANKANHRTIALALAENALDAAKTVSKSGTLTTGTTTVNTTGAGLPYTAKVTSTVTAVNGYSNLYLIAISVIYDDVNSKVALDTYVRASSE